MPSQTNPHLLGHSATSAARLPEHPAKPELRFAAPSDLSATQVAGTTVELPETPEGMAKDELRNRNARLREKINSGLERHPELRDATDELALQQGLHAEAGTPFLERINGRLQERARAIIERRPDLERFFDD
jgi:phytoene dehydrogenase-like protein